MLRYEIQTMLRVHYGSYDNDAKVREIDFYPRKVFGSMLVNIFLGLLAVTVRLKKKRLTLSCLTTISIFPIRRIRSMISILLMDKLSTDLLWLQLRQNQTLVVTWCDCVRTHPSVGQTWLRTRDTATSSSRASGGRGAGRGWQRSGTARRAPSTTRPSTSATSETGWQAVRQVRSLRFDEFFCYNIHRLLLALQHYLISNTESTPLQRLERTLVLFLVIFLN